MAIPRSTLDIANDFCSKAFNLDTSKEYFVKTGTFSSKFDFRNCKINGGEVNDIGEYLLFISHQASSLASPLNNCSIYGAATTNEWVVREYIPDKEHNPTIYKGMPLHTEYRVFVDFDTREVIGISPYWEPKVMKERFSRNLGSVHDTHDYIIYSAHEEVLMSRYRRNVALVRAKVKELISSTSGLEGQWSIDIMQNGEEFWLIDMALAQNSALIDCVPPHLLKAQTENWIPAILVGQEGAETEDCG